MLCVTMDAGIQTGYHNLFNIYYKEGNLLYILGLHAMTLQLVSGRSQFCVDQSMKNVYIYQVSQKKVLRFDL